MRLKIILLTGAIIAIVILALFGSGLKEKTLRGMVDDVPEYNCGEDEICTSCIIGGHTCSCGTSTCECGDTTVNRSECSLWK